MKMANIFVKLLKQNFLVILLLILTAICEISCCNAGAYRSRKALQQDAESQTNVTGAATGDQDDPSEGGPASEAPPKCALKGQLLHRRFKRDIKEIIQRRKVMFPPVILHRTTVALQRMQKLLDDMKILVNEIHDRCSNMFTSTTAMTPAASTTPMAGSTTPMVSPGSTTTTKRPAGSSTPVTTPKPSLTTPTTTTTKKPSKKSGLLIMRLQSRIRGRLIKPSSTTTPPRSRPKLYKVREMIETMKTAFRHSELVIANKLSASSVFALENSVKAMIVMNSTIYKIYLGGDVSQLLFWIQYAKLSSFHAKKKLEKDQEIHLLINKSDKITSLITAAFCVLALVLTILLCFLSFRSRTPGGNYDVDQPDQPNRNPQLRPRNDPTRNPSNMSNPNATTRPIYASPSRAAVTTRSNPLYSSHRSVDVERPNPDNNPNNHNYDDPRPDHNRDDPKAEKNERNANIGRDRSISPQPTTRAPDYKDPRRHRKQNLAKDNDGYDGDEVVRVGPESESVL